MSKNHWDIGDCVRAYGPENNSDYYVYGRIVYIDTYQEKPREYGVLHYNRKKELIVTCVPENQITRPPVPNPPSCPSHSFTMDYVDEIVTSNLGEVLTDAAHKGLYTYQ